MSTGTAHIRPRRDARTRPPQRDAAGAARGVEAAACGAVEAVGISSPMMLVCWLAKVERCGAAADDDLAAMLFAHIVVGIAAQIQLKPPTFQAPKLWADTGEPS